MAAGLAEALTEDVATADAGDMGEAMSEFEMFAKDAGFEGEKAEALRMAIKALMAEGADMDDMDMDELGMEDM